MAMMVSMMMLMVMLDGDDGVDDDVDGYDDNDDGVDDDVDGYVRW